MANENHVEQASAHGLVFCDIKHRDPRWAAPHCQCGKSHEHHGMTFPDRIFTCGGNDGAFFLERRGFAQVEYVRADLGKGD